ncbi:MFS transporter [Actinocatenispora rupis]|uniref:MFS transporter n=2 Tax=Actinocatenispora rupis TaxID=519421 RepID=A0A8J3IYX9_9ACTN|nr:MFS transporter [Actinocatenispora rupis]
MSVPAGRRPPDDDPPRPAGDLGSTQPIDAVHDLGGTQGMDAVDDLGGTQGMDAVEEGVDDRRERSDPVDAGLPERAGPYVEPTPTAMIPKVRRDWVDLVDHWFPERYRVPTIATTAVSLTLTVAFLFLPLAGTDLSAQVARGHFFETYGWHTIDFRWYGGVYPFGYSLLAGPLNALIGARGVGAVSCVLTSAAFAWLLARYRVPRPTVGGVLAALVGVFNLVSGRTTFALGLAVAMFAVVAVSLPRAPRRVRLPLGFVLATGSVAGSPVSGLFLGLAGTAVLIAGLRRRTPEGGVPVGPRLPGGWHLTGAWREGLVLCLGALLGLTPSLMFADGGVQPFNGDSMKVFVAVGVASFFLVPARYRALRVGAVLLVLAILLSYFVPSPIGSNVTRLPMLFCAPLVAAVSQVRRLKLAGAIVALTLWQPPLVASDLGSAGDPAAQSVFYQPLIERLDTLRPVGRIEVVPLYDHWESTYVAEAVPLARGWERQVDVERNPLFYDDSLTPGNYLTWLYRNAVSYVAVPRQVKLDKYGREEAALIAAGLPYLRLSWSNADWLVYRVLGAQQLVSGVGVLVDSGPTGVTFDATSAGRATVRVRWSHWLTLSGPDACFAPEPDGWTSVTVGKPGRYRISSGWHLRQGHRC